MEEELFLKPKISNRYRNILRCSAVVWSASKNIFSIMTKYGHDCKYEICASWSSYGPNMIKIQ